MTTNNLFLMALFSYTFAIFMLLPASGVAQPGPPPDGLINKKIRIEVIDSLASVLVDGYVDPSMAKMMITSIRKNQKAGKYDTIQSGRQFAIELTKGLLEVSHDKHLSVEYVHTTGNNEPDANKADRTNKEIAFRRAVNHGFDKVERLPGNVGLLELRAFLPIDEAAVKIDAAMSLLTDTDALIIDLRYNRGGDPAAVQYLASYLLDSKPVLVNTMIWRSAAGNQPVEITRKAKGPGLIQQSWTYRALPGARYDKNPVFILISEITASGAESFAYSLQALKRATIVGGTSAGAANPGGTDRLTSNFQVFIPKGRPVNAITHTNWEGTGVNPDIESPFEHTMKIAYIHALEEIEKRGNYAGPDDLKMLIDDTKRELTQQANKK